MIGTSYQYDANLACGGQAETDFFTWPLCQIPAGPVWVRASLFTATPSSWTVNNGGDNIYNRQFSYTYCDRHEIVSDKLIRGSGAPGQTLSFTRQPIGDEGGGAFSILQFDACTPYASVPAVPVASLVGTTYEILPTPLCGGDSYQATLERPLARINGLNGRTVRATISGTACGSFDNEVFCRAGLSLVQPGASFPVPLEVVMRTQPTQFNADPCFTFPYSLTGQVVVSGFDEAVLMVELSARRAYRFLREPSHPGCSLRIDAIEVL